MPDADPVKKNLNTGCYQGLCNKGLGQERIRTTTERAFTV